MVLAAYLMGLATLPVAVLAGWLGHLWWRRLRRAQAVEEWEVVTGATVVEQNAPPPLPPQDQVVEMGRVRYGVSVPGRRRVLRGQRPPRSG